MKRTTIMLPEDLQTRASKRAHREGVSLGELIRRALENSLSQPSSSKSEDPFFADKETWRGKAPPDGARRHDKHLYEDRP